MQSERIGTHVTHRSGMQVVLQHQPAWSLQLRYPPDKPQFPSPQPTSLIALHKVAPKHTKRPPYIVYEFLPEATVGCDSFSQLEQNLE